MAISRPILWTISIACGVICVGSIVEMSRRIVAFHEANPPEFFAFRPVNDDRFMWAGREVSITQDTSRPDAPRVVLAYGDQQVRLVPSLPSNNLLPGLIAHSDWLRVQRFIPASGLSSEEVMARFTAGDISERIAIVTRTVRPGTDPQTWGAVWQRDWDFDFYELLPDGTIHHERLGYPTAKARQAPKPGELQQNTWQFQAALALMPPVGRSGPAYNFSKNAIKHVSWTLPAAALSGLAGVLTCAFAAAPQRRRPTGSSPTGSPRADRAPGVAPAVS
ncbi:MAG: hypothetical protein IPM33_03225 [Phycisphaerales bacterium]|nr:hypothetical protein [Phycisphaerales bacterium]